MIRWYAGLLVLAGACYPVQPREEIKPSHLIICCRSTRWSGGSGGDRSTLRSVVPGAAIHG